MQTIQGWQMSISEFSLYSIGLALTRQKRDDVFRDFISDALEDTNVGRVRLDTPDLKRLLDVRREFDLDFDDAYQYAAAEKYNLTIVSFDRDFDRTELGRRTPAQILSANPP